MSQFEITIGSVPDREELIATISYDGFSWAEISHETDDMMVQFHMHPHKAFWDIPLDQAISILNQAKKKMLALGPKNPVPIDARCVDIKKYTNCFSGGTLEDIECKDEEVILKMQSTKVDSTLVRHPGMLSEKNTFIGKLHIEEIKSIKLNAISQTSHEELEKKTGELINLTISSQCVTLLLKKNNDTTINIELHGKNIYWENLPKSAKA